MPRRWPWWWPAADRGRGRGREELDPGDAVPRGAAAVRGAGHPSIARGRVHRGHTSAPRPDRLDHAARPTMIDVTTRYDDVLDPLRRAYDARAAWRDGLTKEPWNLAERRAFRDRLAPGARLLEIGAGAGQDSAYFQSEGFDVVAADLSPAMVELCRSKGIEAHVMDFLHLDFPDGSFDAVYAMKCLL